MKKKTPLLIGFILSVVFCGFPGLLFTVGGLVPGKGKDTTPEGFLVMGIACLAVVAIFAWLYFGKSPSSDSKQMVSETASNTTAQTNSPISVQTEKIELNALVVIFGSGASDYGFALSKTFAESGLSSTIIERDHQNQTTVFTTLPKNIIPILIGSTVKDPNLENLKINKNTKLIFADYLPGFQHATEDDQKKANAYFDKTLNTYNNLLLSQAPSYSYTASGEKAAFFIVFSWEKEVNGFSIGVMAEKIEEAFRNFPRELLQEKTSQEHLALKPEATEEKTEARVEGVPQIISRETPEAVVSEDKEGIKKLLDNLTAIKKGMPVSDLTARFGEPSLTINQAATMGMFGNMTVIGDSSGVAKKENWVFKTKYGEFQIVVQGEEVVDMIFVNPLIEKLTQM